MDRWLFNCDVYSYFISSNQVLGKPKVMAKKKTKKPVRKKVTKKKIAKKKKANRL